MLRFGLGLGAGFAAGYCFPKISALSAITQPVEDALASNLPLPKPELKLMCAPRAAGLARVMQAGGPPPHLHVSMDRALVARVMPEEALSRCTLTGHARCVRPCSQVL